MDTTLADPLLGRVLDGRYRIQERIARGGMATVYRAVDTRLDRPVAVKVMHPSLAEDPDFVSRFTREAKAAARLSHPNVVAVFDQGSDAGTVFLVMEHVDGSTLRDLIRDRGRLSPRQALDLMASVLAALDAAHRSGIVHRDIKPENVLISSDGRVKVADFGLARAIQASHHTATTGLLIGTAAYLAPEQIQHGLADPRTDLYAAGIILYELLTGRPPYEAATPMAVIFKHVHEQVPAPSLLRPEVSRPLDALVLDATRREPADRPPSAAALLEQLEAVARTLPPEPLDLTRPTQVLGPHLTTVLHTGPAATRQQTLAAPVAAPVSPAGSTPQQGRRTRLPGWRPAVALLALLAVAAAIVGYLLMHQHRHTSSTPAGTATSAVTATSAAPPVTTVMQKFTGLSQAAAQTLADDNHLAVTFDPTLVYSDTVPAGNVVSQDPSDTIGQPVPPDTPVTLVLSKGQQLFTVPAKLVGMQLTAAKTALQAVNLDLGKHPSQYDPTVPAGAIISVTTTQTALPAKSVVDVVSSKGPQPVAVPDEHGRSATVAEADLTAKGFTNVSAIRAFSSTVSRGEVISQTPSLPASVQPSAAITLVVSKGPELFAVPYLKGLSAGAAEAKLVALHLKYHTQRLPNGPGNVLYTTPSAGQLVPAGTVVTLEIF